MVHVTYFGNNYTLPTYYVGLLFICRQFVELEEMLQNDFSINKIARYK